MRYLTRPATPEDFNRISEIWLAASKAAHNFVPYSFWEDQQRDLREIYLPNSQVWICLNSKEIIVGFIALRDSNIEALFVLPGEQKKGIGKILLDNVKSIRQNLTLCVYEKNFNAKAFYNSQGFEIINRRIEEKTAEWELLMEWGGNE